MINYFFISNFTKCNSRQIWSTCISYNYIIRWGRSHWWQSHTMFLNWENQLILLLTLMALVESLFIRVAVDVVETRLLHFLVSYSQVVIQFNWHIFWSSLQNSALSWKYLWGIHFLWSQILTLFCQNWKLFLVFENNLSIHFKLLYFFWNQVSCFFVFFILLFDLIPLSQFFSSAVMKTTIHKKIHLLKIFSIVLYLKFWILIQHNHRFFSKFDHCFYN